MKLKDSLNKRLNTRLASLVMLSVLSVPWVASAAGNSVVANNMLPGNGNVIAGTIEGGFKGSWAQGNQMNLHQTTQNAIVTWDSFSIGANATVTIRGDHDNFNMLNYVTGSESSQIYGKLNSYVGDKQGGNIYLVNPNGVQIGNSAEINVGSLHIANKKIDNINTWNENTDIAKALKQNKAMTNAELMSLGYINANKLVFEGERVVIDMDRLSGLDTTKADALTIVTQPYDGESVGDNRKYDVVLGSSTPKNAQEWGKYIGLADNGTGDRWQGTVQAGNPDAPNQSVTEFFTYRWIKDGKELEKIGQETGWGMGDHYALRYSIDLTGSNQTPIGTTKENAFKGKFDGLDNSIFGLSIKNSKNKYAATGLFGFTNGAIMGNVTLIAGDDGISIQGGNTDTGAFIGHAVNTTVKGVNSTLKVSGTNNVGGIIGYAKADTGRTYNFADAAGSVQPDSRSSELSNLTNTGNVSGVSNVGGLVGYMNGGKLSNDEENRVQYKGSYNLGKITGINKGTNYSSNIGGMIGKAENATIGGTKNTLINYNTVEGGYNVGGIVGSISNTTVANASNEGVVKANGYTTDYYIYHTDYTGNSWQNNNGALAGTHKAEVLASNVGGIVGSSAGSELKDVTNKADVSSALVKKTTDSVKEPTGFDHYAAGNVGGIVGRAEDSNITNANNVESNIHNIIYTWISNAEELNSLQRVAENLNDGRDALSYNYILKNDIDASGLVNASTYNTIGRGNTAFTGTFDGDGHTIVGLQAEGGIFGQLGSGAVVKNINIASSVFTGNNIGDSVGAVAAENNGGSISGISGYGNTIKGSGGSIGGLVGKNYGGISNSNDHSTVIAGADTVAGGIAGVNGTKAGIGGTIDNVQSNSAVTTGGLTENQYADNLGGIVGKNELSLNTYNINNVSAHGVTGKTGNTKTSGGIVGTNEGIISNAYNESIIHGSENIGGVAGKNVTQAANSNMAKLNDVANAAEIIGDAGSQNIGGLVGMQEHVTTNQGRNTGAITGCTNVGGMVGHNTADSYLKNLENSPQATITGITYVGGIVGVNEGEISADNQLNLVNSGKINGWENVGGIAGKNSGTIDNVNSNINLYVIDEATRDALKGGTAGIADSAQFFGGVTGENVGIITNATNRARVDAAQASYVGGIVGRNTSENGKVGKLLGMGNSNKGFVIGNNYVGGVIGKNEVTITGTAKQSVGIVNSGTVIALAGGAGGIIGENSANITHVIMTNEGEVHGNASDPGSREENGTGGIIGVNADGAIITNSSLMNRVNGNVSGVANVGGIIGINHGIITGGRDDNDNYYKYQIYNNGTIQAGSYKATNGTITAFAGENIGGLLGNNSGTLTAGYNTGVVDAGQSSNVGGIAGTNSGKLDQVFNSVVTVIKTETDATDANGRKLYNYTYTDGGAISGASNVGGIVGSNTGTLSNAYSTTAVEGNSNVANIVGSNAGQVSNIYGYAANRNTNVTNVNGGTVSKSYIIKADGKLAENGQNANKLDSYDFEDKKTTWKLYDKRTNPLLKVFLTKVTVADDLQQGWVYDATNHLDIHGWINSGKLKTNDAANDAFKAYNNNSSLLQGEALKNGGTYSSWLWSGQIASGGVAGPNNLGYDFTVGDIKVAKKVLNVTGNTVNRTYGDLKKDTKYALSIDGFNSFNDAMQKELNGKVNITDSQETIQNNQDTGIITVDSEKRTDNKGAYKWHAGVKLDDSLTSNYEFQNDGVSNTTTTVQGVSNVLARKVSLKDINASTIYGSKEGLKADGNVSLKANSIVYGDQVSLKDGASVSYKADGEYAANKGGRDTADVGTYDNSLKIDNAALTGDVDKLGNYELVNNATGSITVAQAEMHVKLNGVERTYGNAALINGTAYGVNGLTGNVNGDNYAAGNVTMGAVTDDGALTGALTGKVTNDADTYKWNADVAAANDKLKQNYKLVVDGGASVVKPATLQVSLNDVVRTYGNAAITSGSYSASGITGLVNGDSYNAGDVKVTVTGDGAIAGVSGNRVTNDVDNNYIWSGNLTTDNARLGKNYKLELKGNGKSVVGKATLTFVVDDKIITQNVPAEYTGTANGLTNGDTLAGIGVGGYELDSSVNPLIVGVYEDKIGVLINGSLHLTGSDSLLKNYRVEVNPGTLTVLISSDPTNAYWFGTAPWDKERNLRERKAEFHYVAGGMSL